jgi:hypothetical protein
MRFKLIPGAGSHSEFGPDGQIIVYKAEDGKIIETDRDLAAQFVNKFERVEVAVEELVAAPVEEAAEAPPKKFEAKKPKRKSTKRGPKSKLGRNVTFRFPGAAEQDFLIFADGGAFYVVDKDEVDKPLNEKPLHKDEVAPFMTEYLKT